MQADRPYDVAEFEDNAGRFASLALTSNLAATALNRIAEDPHQPLAGRYQNALNSMAQTIELLSDLQRDGELDALMDPSLGVVDSLEPAQLVARLGTELEPTPTGSRIEDLNRLLTVLDKLQTVVEDPDAALAAEIAPYFKSISRNAMLYAQRAEETHNADDGYMRLFPMNA